MISGQIQARLKELHLKWKNKTISDDELFELREWLEINHIQPIDVPFEIAQSEEEIEKRILSSIKANRETVVVPMMKRRSLKWIAAASIIVIGSLVSLLWFLPPNTLITSTNKNSVSEPVGQPGENKAILQLADGSTIELGNIADGKVKDQGSAAIFKSGEGLTYSNTVQKSESFSEVYNTMFTPRGGQYKLTLADGSIVWLNSGSSIHYPTTFLGKERVVELRGEAYFEIAKNAHKPFRVKVEDTYIEVLGTSFNVNAYSDEVEIQTTLIEGMVNVNLNNGKNVRLTPGDQAKIDRREKSLLIKKNVDVDQVISWQQGIFQFRNAEVALIARQISRWYDVDVNVRENIRNVKLGGGISKKVPLSKLLELLHKQGINYKWENTKLILYGS